MKATRSELKSIVKECLLEILNEGLGGQMNADKMHRPTPNPIFMETSRRPQQSSATSQKRSSTTPQLKEAIRMEAGGNKVMEAILADTAASTLPKMLQGDSKGYAAPAAGGLVEQVVASASPEDLFGEDATSKWAHLAFMDSPTKK